MIVAAATAPAPIELTAMSAQSDVGGTERATEQVVPAHVERLRDPAGLARDDHDQREQNRADAK